MKVLYVCPTFYPENSGYANAFMGLVRAIDDKYEQSEIDLEVIAFTNTEPQKITKDNNLFKYSITYLYRGKTKINKIFSSFLNTYKLVKIARSSSSKIMFFETMEMPLLIYICSILCNKKIAFRIHATYETEYIVFFSSFKNIILKYFIKYVLSQKVKYVCATSVFHIEFYKRHFLKENIFKIAQKIFFVIPNTVLHEKDICFSVMEGPPLNKGIKQLKKVLLLGRQDTIGFLQKGVTDFIFAYYKLPEKIRSQYEIKIVGDGTYHNYLRELCKEINQIEYIKRLNNNQIISLLSEVDVTILVSRFEGVSMFALESLLCHNMVVFSKTGGLVELVNENGFSIPVQDIDELTKVLYRIANMPDKDIQLCKLNSYKLYQEKFSNEVVAKNFFDNMKVIEL